MLRLGMILSAPACLIGDGSFSAALELLRGLMALQKRAEVSDALCSGDTNDDYNAYLAFVVGLAHHDILRSFFA